MRAGYAPLCGVWPWRGQRVLHRARSCKEACCAAPYHTEAIARLSEVTDKMHGLLLDPTDALMGCVEGNPEEAELAALADVIERYERYRFHP